MADRPEPANERAGGITMRTAEILVAVVLFAIGSLVVYDSHRLGSSWGADGPEAGYFPFYVGLIICISSAVVLIENLRSRGDRAHASFVEWQPLRQVLSVLLPAAAFVLGIQLIGLYVAAAIYIACFMRWLGNYSVLSSVGLGTAVSVLTFLTFEVWFQVPLYKGAFDPLSFLGY